MQAYRQMNKTLVESDEAMEKVNFIADKMIWAGYALIASLASFATYKILTKYLIKPFVSTYRFLTNQSRNVQELLHQKYGKGLAIICGGKSGLSTTYGAYLAEMGYESILFISSDAQKLESKKKRLKKLRKDTPTKPFTVLTYNFDFDKVQTEESRNALRDYIIRVTSKYEDHCSILVNNIAVREADFNMLAPAEIASMSNIKIENHTFMTRLLMVELRNKSLRKYRSAVINVGTTKETLIETKRKFETLKEQTDYEVFRATTIYWANLATLTVRTEATEVDFVKDSPENQGFFEENLKYLGLEVTAGSHVDQVCRQMVSYYKSRSAQGIFKHKWMLYLMKPFFWALLPLKFVGLLQED